MGSIWAIGLASLSCLFPGFAIQRHRWTTISKDSVVHPAHDRAFCDPDAGDLPHYSLVWMATCVRREPIVGTHARAQVSAD